MQEILKYIRKADEDFNLIEDNDVLVLGVSGGKDSVVLLHALSLYQKFKEKHFKLIAVHMNMGFDNVSIDTIKQYASSLNVPFHSIDVPIYEILKHYKKDDGSLDCARCSNLKRGAIVNIAKEMNANKVVFAHHADDAIETLVLNAIHSARLDTFMPKISYEDNEIDFIRPMVYVSEQKIIQITKKLNIPTCKSGCANDGNTKRAEIKQLLATLYKTNPQARNNLLKCLKKPTHLWNNFQ